MKIASFLICLYPNKNCAINKRNEETTAASLIQNMSEHNNETPSRIGVMGLWTATTSHFLVNVTGRNHWAIAEDAAT